MQATKNRVGSLLQQWTDAGYKDTARGIQKRPTGSVSAETTDSFKRMWLIGGLKESLKDRVLYLTRIYIELLSLGARGDPMHMQTAILQCMNTM